MTTNRLNKIFAEKQKTRFIGFMVAGDPDFETSEKILCSLPDYGVDVVELGMPFSDPMADGPAIQLGYGRALKNGQTMAKTFQLVEKFRQLHPHVPLVLMGYANPIYFHGAKSFFQNCKKAGVDGVIIVDLPPEESQEILPIAEEAGVATVRLLAQTSDDARIKKLVTDASGFLYYVSVLGITGSRHIDVGGVLKRIEVIKNHTALPIAVGFGITQPQDVAELNGKVAGVVVGSALVRTIQDSLEKNCKSDDIAKNLLEKAKELSSPLH